MNLVKLIVFSAFLLQSFLVNATVVGSLQAIGTFTQVPGSPFATGAQPFGVAFSPVAGTNLFVAIPNSADSTVSEYLVNQATGFLTPVAGSPFTTGGSPFAVAYSPVISGNLYVATANADDNNVSVFAVNEVTGAFTQVPGSPFAAGEEPFALAFSSLVPGKVTGNVWAAVANAGDNTVSAYGVDLITGAFTPVAGSAFATGSEPRGVAFSPVASGKVSGNLFAAVSNFNDNTVSVYAVDQSTGFFTPVVGSPFATGSEPRAIAFSPLASGNVFAAIANFGDNTVSVYLVNQATGVFMPVGAFATGTGPIGVAFSPVVSGTLLAAVSNNGGTVSVYTVNTTTGVFTPVAGSPFAAGNEPFGVAFSPLVIGNLFAAVANNGGNNVAVFDVAVPPPPPAVPPSISMSFSPSEICTCENSMLTINLLNPIPTIATLTSPLIDRLPPHLDPCKIVFNTCGGFASIQGSTVTLSGSSIPASGSCFVSVLVTSKHPGLYTNFLPIGALQTTQGSNAVAASATLEVCEE